MTRDRAYVCREIRTGLALLAFYEEQGVLFSVHKGEVRTAGDEELTCAQRDWIAQSSEHILLALRYRQKSAGFAGPCETDRTRRGALGASGRRRRKI